MTDPQSDPVQGVVSPQPAESFDVACRIVVEYLAQAYPMGL